MSERLKPLNVMKTLFDRLTPTNSSIISEYTLSFPITGGRVMDELNTKTHWVELSYRCVTDICHILNSKDYSPIFIDELFSNK